MGTVNRLHADAPDPFPASKKVNCVRLAAGFDKRRRTSRLAIEGFQGSTPEHQSFGLIGTLCHFLDNANRYGVASKLDCQGQSNRASADDENALRHEDIFSFRGRMCHCGSIGISNCYERCTSIMCASGSY